VLALPSHSEGSPNVLLEAMAAGLPVVATRVGGVPEIVAHEESALLVDARDPQAFAAAVGRVLTDGELARALAARAGALAATRFSPESYRHSLVEIYRELISSPEASAKARAA
jgi:glycosyltransferase involved in cell wall biosynthesis